MLPWLGENLAEPEEAIKLRIWERDDIADILAALNIKVPDWAIGAIIWYVFSKVVLDSLSAKKPGTEINLAIIASKFDLPGLPAVDIGDFPPGIKVAAFIDVVLTAIEVAQDSPITKNAIAKIAYDFLRRFDLIPPAPVGFKFGGP